MPLFTFIVDFEGGTYVSQVTGSTLFEAASMWARGQGGSTIHEVAAFSRAAEPELIDAIERGPTPLAGLRHVWCYEGLLDDRLFLINCVQTEQ